MPIYSVHCVHPETGAGSVRTVDAVDEDDAREQFAAEGLLTSNVRLVSASPAAAVNTVGIERALAAMGSDLAQLTLSVQRIQRSRLVRAPIGTIATAIIVAVLVWMALAFLFFITFGSVLLYGGRQL
jgi:hypothetical protein